MVQVLAILVEDAVLPLVDSMLAVELGQFDYGSWRQYPNIITLEMHFVHTWEWESFFSGKMRQIPFTSNEIGD